MDHSEPAPMNAWDIATPGSSDGRQTYIVAANHSQPSEKALAPPEYSEEQDPPVYSDTDIPVQSPPVRSSIFRSLPVRNPPAQSLVVGTLNPYQNSSRNGYIANKPARKRRQFFNPNPRSFRHFEIAILFIICIVLGGVLGGVLVRRKSSTATTTDGGSPTSVASSSSAATPTPTPTYFPTSAIRAKTGVALTTNGEAVYSYYINTQNLIIEWVFSTGTPTGGSASFHSFISNSVPASNTTLAAVVWYGEGQTSATRAIFYFDSNGLLTTQNTTGNGIWSHPYNGIAPNLPAVSESAPIAACPVPRGGVTSEIRVYYGVASNFESAVDSAYIKEVIMEYDASSSLTQWTIGASFEDADGRSGVACGPFSMFPAGNWTHLYARNNTDGVLQQYLYNIDTYSSWINGVRPSWPYMVAVGGSIAVAYGAGYKEYVFFQNDTESVHAVYFGYVGAEALDSDPDDQVVHDIPWGFRPGNSVIGNQIAAVWYDRWSQMSFLTEGAAGNLLFFGLTDDGAVGETSSGP